MPTSLKTRPSSPHPNGLRRARNHLDEATWPRVPKPILHSHAALRENRDVIMEELSPSPLLTYTDMILDLDNVPRLYNILAGFFSWLLLAGYIVLPGTFASIQNSRTLANGAGKAGKLVVKAVQNAPLLYVAAFMCGISTCGLCWLWFEKHSNYVWVLNRLIL
jgi:hypothetical protein